MDTTELHYISFDPDEMFREMQQVYMENGGDVLYPGDEKEMLLRSVQAVCVQAAGNVDNALRMATLRYAAGEYLDLIGENRNCPRIQAQAAKAAVEIRLRATGNESLIPAGTGLTADGKRVYTLDSDITVTGYSQTIRAGITAEITGSGGNGLTSGMQMQFLSNFDGIISVYTVTDAAGGEEREEDEIYRERIRQHGLANATTGPQNQYETKAKEVSSLILDARALNGGAGNVGVYLVLSTTEGAAAIIEQVKNALNARSERPLTDNVSVSLAAEKEYTLHVKYADDGAGIAAEAAAMVADYQKWQDNTIGRAFNPDRLMASIYQAGASRVIWGEGSSFDGGEAVYTEIPANAHCKGTITIEVLP